MLNVRNMKFHEYKTDIYLLKGLMEYPVHGTSITAYGAKGRLCELQHFYLCVKSKECGQSNKIENVQDSNERILSQISGSAQILNLYKKIMEKLSFSKSNTLFPII